MRTLRRQRSATTTVLRKVHTHAQYIMYRETDAMKKAIDFTTTAQKLDVNEVTGHKSDKGKLCIGWSLSPGI
jgi:hypothetical protein